MIKEDYASEGEHSIRLARGDVVELLDNSIEDRWFVRRTGPLLAHGWVPAHLMDPAEETDFGPSKKNKWEKITSGRQRCREREVVCVSVRL